MGRRTVGGQPLSAGGSRQLTVLLDNDTHAELGRLAALNGESICTVVRRAVNQLLAGEIVGNTPSRRLLLARMLHVELGAALDGLTEEGTAVRTVAPSPNIHWKDPLSSSSDPTGLACTIEATQRQGVA